MQSTARQESFEEVRTRISAEHAVLRAELGILSDAAHRVIAHEELAAREMREALWTVYLRVVDHLATEERRLLPLLEGIDGWGPFHASTLLEEHRQQRIVLNAVMDESEFGTTGDLELADDAAWLVGSISKDIAAELKALDVLQANAIATSGD
jgi:iron-sulfur cluster repair protein YtfE (RIC family)